MMSPKEFPLEIRQQWLGEALTQSFLEEIRKRRYRRIQDQAEGSLLNLESIDQTALNAAATVGYNMALIELSNLFGELPASRDKEEKK